MKIKIFIVGMIILILIGGIVVFEYREEIFPRKEKALVLYGNVDDRQVNLAFIISERIAEVKVEEGDVVKKGQLVATLETVRIKNSVDSSRAAVEIAKQEYVKAKNGPRTEDIDIARAAVAAAEAAVESTGRDYYRQELLAKTTTVAEKMAEQAEAKYLVSKAALNAARRQLDQMLIGTRAEDIAAAAATLERQEVEYKIAEQKLTDAQLFAPVDGVIRNRLLEPGEMASPSGPVLTIAITDPKWVRTFIPETLLSKVRHGGKAKITADGPGKVEFAGWVGFISPNAEFTPKTVETIELRTALVYEVRVYIKDPEGVLKLGAPVTITFETPDSS